MIIMSSDGKQLLNSEHIERYCLADKSDAVLVVASYSDSRPPVTMGRYANMDEASRALGQLYVACASGDAYFDMPDSTLYHEGHRKRDARTKRKGGS